MEADVSLALLGGTKSVRGGQVPDWPPIGRDAEEAVLEALRSGRHAAGGIRAAFEAEFAQWNGSKYCIATNSGTAALHMCLSWLYDHNCAIFKAAGSHPKGKTWDFPHERQCHRKGKAAAVAIFGEEEFRQCLIDLKKNEICEHKEVLDFLLGLDASPYVADISKKLIKDVRKYYQGVESNVHQIWKDNPPSHWFDINKFIPA